MSEPGANLEPASSRPRRWFRFSLRTFLIAVTLVSLAFGFFFNSVQNERRAASAIAAAHGDIVYDWQIRPPGADPKTPPKPPGPQWLRKHFGPHWLDRIVEVRLNEYINKSDKNRFAVVAPHLAELSSLRSLSLPGAVVAPHLAKLSSLRSLTLSGETFDVNDYRSLSQLSQLESLLVRQKNELLPEHAAAIARLTGLRDLYLSDVKTSPEALRELAKSPHLEKLDISCFWHDPNAGGWQTEYQLRDEAAEALADFPMLKSLMLFQTRITDAGMEKLCRLSKLERLSVSSPHITSASFDHVLKLKRLTALGTWAWKIEDDDLQKLSQMPQLKSLDLLTHLSDKSVPHVTSLGQIERLRLRGEGITDASVPHLLQLTKLQWLHLSGTSINKLGPAAKELKRAFPKCVIYLPKTEKQKEAEREFNDWRFGGGNF